MSSALKDIFLHLIRLSTGCEPCSLLQPSMPLSVCDWQALENLANVHGLLGVMLDGVEKLPRELRPEKMAIIQSIGQLIQSEQQHAVQGHAAANMALLLHKHGILTYVLKGNVVAECYPRPEHRRSVDMDCFLAEGAGSRTQVLDSKTEDIWERGNRVLEEQGCEVRRDFYKNSTVILPGLTVENHRYLTPFRGNKTLHNLEMWLQSQLKEDSVRLKDISEIDSRKFEGTWLYRPPVMVSALFLIEHAYSHFLHEGLTWRLVLDWMMFSKKHKDEIDWQALNAHIYEFGFRKFYDSFCRLGQYLLGELSIENLEHRDKLMLEDVWADLDLHETVRGFKGKIALVGNTWRARWKYKYFSEISMPHALWIQIKGFMFDKNPKLG